MGMGYRRLIRHRQQAIWIVRICLCLEIHGCGNPFVSRNQELTHAIAYTNVGLYQRNSKLQLTNGSTAERNDRIM